jgi:hypothetical protein
MEKNESLDNNQKIDDSGVESESSHGKIYEHASSTDNNSHISKRKFDSSLSDLNPSLRCRYCLVLEDSPELSLERERLRRRSYDKFIIENIKYGDMVGSSKTSASCRRHGFEIGMRGVFSRLLWHQQLRNVENGEVGSSKFIDGIFPLEIYDDEAVVSELVDAGRTYYQAKTILKTVLNHMTQACVHIANMRDHLLGLSQFDIRVERIGSEESLTSLSYILEYKQNYYQVSESHLLKLLRLYGMYTDSRATIEDLLFVSAQRCSTNSSNIPLI